MHTEIINVKEHNDTREEQLQLAFDDGALVLSGAPDVTPATTHMWDMRSECGRQEKCGSCRWAHRKRW